MSRSSFALFVALLIHLVILLLLWIILTLSPQPPKEQPEEKRLKISLKELPKKYKDSGLTKEKITPPKVAPPMPKGSQLKEIVQQQVRLNPQATPKTPKLNPPKKVQETKVTKPKIEPLPPKKPYIPLLAKTEEKNTTKESKDKSVNSDPMAWLSEDRSTEQNENKKNNANSGSNVSSDLKELYGEEFGKLSPGQQKYILDNQEYMRRVTQQVLNRVARVNLDGSLNVNRNNVVEFYLHPNGDMSDFRFLSKSGYYTLDDITKETIEYAYSKYPRPTEKTLIRYNVYYHLSRY
ncbi:MAG: TonB C-terminal domain-containing protein [Campylobacterales bacterium]|nr:TonB C-terminal domain-containing protein [Campylobacterales bacterium]